MSNQGALPEEPGQSSPRGALLDILTSSQRAVAELEALQFSVFAGALQHALSGSDGTAGDSAMRVRELAAEIGAAMRLPDRTVERLLGEATDLIERFPATFDAMQTGRITRQHVRVIVDAGGRLDDDARAEYESRLVEIAAVETAGRLRRVARGTAERLQPQSLDERHAMAAEQRGVFVTDLDDGMACLTAVRPATLAHGVHDRLSAMGRAVKAADPDDCRTLSQVRADLLCDLALTAVPAGHDELSVLSEIKAEVSIVVPVLTLLDQSTDAALLDGAQPVDPATARALAGAAPGWTRILTHPIAATPLAVDRYRPSKHQRRLLRALDERCRFPGCGYLARHCDLDHHHDAALGGATSTDNLSHLCRRHHMLKHHSRWTVVKQGDGVVVWTSPTKRQYPDRHYPETRGHGVRFEPPSAGGSPPPGVRAPDGKPPPAPF